MKQKTIIPLHNQTQQSRVFQQILNTKSTLQLHYESAALSSTHSSVKFSSGWSWNETITWKDLEFPSFQWFKAASDVIERVSLNLAFLLLFGCDFLGGYMVFTDPCQWCPDAEPLPIHHAGGNSTSTFNAGGRKKLAIANSIESCGDGGDPNKLSRMKIWNTKGYFQPQSAQGCWDLKGAISVTLRAGKVELFW